MKKFILVCPKTAVAYNEVFRLFKNAAVCFGYTRPNFEGLEGLCRWLFSLLFELKKEMEWKSPEDVTDFIQKQIARRVRPNRDNKGQPDNAVRYQSQIGGFLSERLLTLYLRHNYKPAEIATVQYTKMETCF